MAKVHALRALVIATLCVALTAASPPGGQPYVRAASPGTNGKIAFEREGDIFTMNADGTGVFNLTNTPCCSTEFNPRRSEFEPAWSPDGTKLAFTRVTSNNAGNTSTRIFVMNADGSGIQAIQTGDGDATARPSSPSWSPAGDAIVYDVDYDGPTAIERVNINNTGFKRLIGPSSTFSRHPAWSPNGHEIAFSRVHEGQRDIFVMKADGTEQSPISDETGHGVRPSWSPDGTRIVFYTLFTQEIYSVNADGSEQDFLSDSGQNPAWAPDGSKILFDSSRDDPDIPPHNVETYAMNPDGTEPSRLTNSDSVMELDPDWQAIGNQPLDTSTTISLRTTKHAHSIKGSGEVRPNHFGSLVVVSLQKKRAGRFRELARKTLVLDATSHYSTRFQRPKGGACKMTAKFKGDGFHRASEEMRRFKC